MSEPQKLLIIANSARMLAQYADSLGYAPFVIDCYCDADTQSVAKVCIKVHNLALIHIKTAVLQLKDQFSISQVIYGSGFERYQESLEFLQKNLITLGNDAKIFAAVQDKPKFFTRLDYLQINYPKVSFHQQKLDGHWLLKPLHGEGGVGIKKYTDPSQNTNTCYWQNYVDGLSMSVLFIANAINYKVIGFHKQLTTHYNDNEFIFSGLISHSNLDQASIQKIQHWIAKLVVVYSLKGINSLDFIVKNKRCYLLEINARPSASMQLYNDSLLLSHINCFMTGELYLADYKQNDCRAYKIIFAETEIAVNKRIKWPDWVTDRPIECTIIHTGMPICSIIACGNNEQYVQQQLLLRQKIISELLQ